MKFETLLALVGAQPVFETGLLLAGDVDPGDVSRQLSRWARAGRLIQLRRGLYALATPYRKVTPHPFVIANRMARGSYVSCQSALSWAGMIPEIVPGTVSVYTGRPGEWETPLGSFGVRHVHRKLFFGYREVEVAAGQRAFVAWPEKALLDLVHLTPGADDPRWLAELRLQDVERLDVERLRLLAERSGRPKLVRAARNLGTLEQARGYEAL